jgi:MFS family permease
VKFTQPGSRSGFASAITGLAQFLACLSAGIVIEKLGRKRVWILSFGMVALTDFLHALYWIPAIHDKQALPNWYPILIIFLNLFAFGLGAGPLPWFLIPERFPTSIRATAVSLATASNWAFSFAVIFLFPVMKSGMGAAGAFITYAAVSLGGLIFGIFTVSDPELKPQGLHTDIYNEMVSS